MHILQVGVRDDDGGGMRVLHDLENLTDHSSTHTYTLCVKDIVRLRRYIQTQKVDLIQSHGTRAATIVRLALATLRSRPAHVYTVHGFHLMHTRGVARRLILLCERILNRWTDRIITVSQEDKEHIVETGCFHEAKIYVIPNGIDVARFDEATPLTRNQFDCPEDATLLLHVSRLHPQKDLQCVIHALTRLPDSYHLLLVGDGVLRDALHAQAVALDVATRVHFLGRRSDIPHLLKTADVLLLSSHWEGCPLVVLEAMAAHTPVIASRVSGTRELIQEQETGRLFTEGNADELAHIIQEVICSDLGMHYANHAFTYVKNTHSLAQMRATYLRVWEEIL